MATVAFKQTDEQFDSEIVGICINRDCTQQNRFVSYEQIFEKHSSHSNDIIVFKQLENENEATLETLFKDKEIMKIY